MDIRTKTQGFSLKGKSCCLIGCGGLGTNIAVHLAGAGIGKLVLCDFDKIESSNLNRQFLYSQNDIGKEKCLVMQERLSAYNTESIFVAVPRKIEKISDLDFAKGCDLVISAVDNLACRKILEAFCDENNIPLSCGGIDGFYGIAYLYLPQATPSPSSSGFFDGEKAKYNISATAGVIGSAQAALSIQFLLTEDKNICGKALLFDGANFETLLLKNN